MNHKENLNFLYYQYKNCLRNKFENHLNKNNAFMDYNDQCKTERSEIQKYQETQYEKIGYVNALNQEAIYNRLDEAYTFFNAYGWTDKQVKNL